MSNQEEKNQADLEGPIAAEDYSKVRKQDVDVAFGIAAELDHEHYQLTPEMDRKVRWKIDLLLLPMMSITSTLSFLDKVTNNYAQAAGLSKNLHLTGNEYSWTASIFYFAFMVWQPAMSYITQKLPIGKVVAVNCVAWGTMILAQGFVKSFGPFMALRFFQGIFEAALLPSFLLMSSQWWKRSEQSLRAAFWFNSVAGILGGIFAYVIEHIHGSLPFVWQYIYVIYGAITMGWGLLMIVVLPDSPVNAWFLKPEERLAAVARVKDNKTGIQAKHFKKEQLIEALKDPKTWFFFLFTYAANVPNGGLNAFSTSIIEGFGYDVFQTDLLHVPFGAIGTFGNLLIGYALAKTKNLRLVLIAGITLIPLIGEIIQFTISAKQNKGAALAGYYLTGCFNAPYVMMLSIAASNTAGHTKKVVVNGIIWMAYCAGNISGPFFFITDQAPRYKGGVAALLVCFVLQVIGAIGFRFYLHHLNSVRDKIQLETGIEYDESAEAAFMDHTDKENESFRYTY